MNDPRLIRWLEATKLVLEAPTSERIRALETAHATRTQLMQELTERPAAAPEPNLARALETCEKQLQALLLELPAELRDRVYELRKVRQAARGYLPPTPNDPSLISREV